MTQTVIGVFDTPDAAHRAEEKLISRGIAQSDMRLDASENAYESADESLRARQKSITGGIREFFSHLFGSESNEEAGHYSEAVRRGGVILAVDVPEGTPVSEVSATLTEAGAIDIDQRVEQWRTQGYAGYNPESKPYTADEIARERSTVLPVIEENVEVGKREVGTGSVRVYSHTVEKPFEETVKLREEHATIERRPVDRPATPADLQAGKDKTVEVQETAEKAVVSKNARVVEEVEVGKEIRQHAETVKDTVRNTEVEVDRAAAPGGAASGAAMTRPYEDYEADFRKDYQTRYGTLGGSFDEYAPAYRYGHTLGSDARYRGKDWSAIEADAERDWGQRYPDSAWERFKLAVRHGWESVTGQH